MKLFENKGVCKQPIVNIFSIDKLEPGPREIYCNEVGKIFEDVMKAISEAKEIDIEVNSEMKCVFVVSYEFATES